MKKVTVLAIMLVAFVALVGCATTQAPNASAPMPERLSSQDDAEVRAIVAQFANTWNRHDMKEMHELDSEDAQWINVAGNIWRGKPTVFKGHGVIHRTIYAKTPMRIEEVEVRPIAPNVAVVVAQMWFGRGLIPPSVEVPEVRTRGSFIMAKRDGAWKIVHFQNTTIDPDKPDPVTWDETRFTPKK
jgi:uncharacterized protein (TIGR02246 family)